MTKGTCLNCGHAHTFIEEGNFCSQKSCWCTNYESDGMQAIVGIQRAIAGLNTVQERINYMLTNVPEFCELNNKDFVFTYWHFNHHYVVPPRIRKELTDPETIRRGKQLEVEHHEEFAPKGEEITYAKWLKEAGYREEVINQK